ncbi:hypothetical protein QEN19_002645 [Hanseniaspora menglaensis]
MTINFSLVNSTTNIDANNVKCELSSFIVMDELLDFLVDVKEFSHDIDTIKVEFSKYPNTTNGSNVLIQRKELYTDSFSVNNEKQIKSVVGETFSCNYINENFIKVSTYGIFNKFIYSHLLSTDILTIKLTVNKSESVIHEYSIKSFIKLQVTDCLLKKLSKNMMTISICLDDKNEENFMFNWDIQDFSLSINNKISVPVVGNIDDMPIKCKNKEAFNVNYSLKWNDIIKQLEIDTQTSEVKYFLARFSLEYKLKIGNRSFKFVNTTKYTKQFLLGDSLANGANQESDTLEKDSVDVVLLDEELKENKDSYFITIPQGKVTTMHFKISKKLGEKSNLKDLVIFQYFKKATLHDFKKFKGLSISLRVNYENTRGNSLLFDGDTDRLDFSDGNTNVNITPMESEPMTRVSIPSTPGAGNPYQKQNSDLSMMAIKSHVSEKYWQWKKSLRLLPSQCGLVLLDDDYQISFPENENSIIIAIRIVGIQKGYYPNLSNIKLYDLSGTQNLIDFCTKIGVLCT